MHLGAERGHSEMLKDIRKFVRTCEVFQKNKSNNSAYKGLPQPLEIPNRFWGSVSMDFIESLPKSKGKSVIFVVVDKLSKMSHFMSLQYPFSSRTVAELFVDNVSKLHGMPTTIISDRGKKYKQHPLKQYMDTHCPHTVCSRKLKSGRGERIINSQGSHTLNHKIPFEKSPESQCSVQKLFHKFSSKYFGPCQVLERIGKVAYKPELRTDTRIHNVFHVSQLKSFKGTPAAIENIPQLSTQQTRTDKIMDEQDIMVHEKMKRHMLINWDGAQTEDQTWEDAEVIGIQCPEMLATRRQTRQKSLRRGRRTSEVNSFEV
ncbi:uncharacterized protein LOC124924506 [Impatiens glandulifera]|uniref:uncharacterized protein LOC124924506 n=1 Tax=Impatiens glandulifera TaxID=253017 RepID=UPI001FB19085|nr:uncharacterized protein LOC124924506 [Impatiens glandulifera]